MSKLAQHLVPTAERQEPIDFADEQWKIFWSWKEPKVEKDIQDILVNFTEAEKHAVITTLRLFSLYETHAGSEYWSGRFTRIFDGSEFHRMGAVFAAFELGVHAPFYNRINELLHINTPEFFTSYEDNPVLKNRMEHIGAIINHPNDYVSLGAFSMVEGVILYSNFGFLRHYQAQGKNKLVNTIRGLNFSVRDENLHSKAGAWAFKYKLERDNPTLEERKQIELMIREAAQTMYEHEKEIIKLTFSKGKIENITELQLDNFVQSRINICLKELGYEPMFKVTYDPISEWFYKGINNYSYNDFFSGLGSQYHRDWDEEAFKWKVNNE